MRYPKSIVPWPLALLVVALAACSTPHGGNSSLGGQGSSAEATSVAGPVAKPVDVCALLTDDDARDVATKAPLVNAGSVIYTVKREKQTYSSDVKPPLGGCKFEFYSQTSDTGTPSLSAAVGIEARDAGDFGIYKGGTPVAGLGDEAYNSSGSTVVRRGNVMLSAGENSATDDFVVQMYRRMVPNLH